MAELGPALRLKDAFPDWKGGRRRKRVDIASVRISREFITRLTGALGYDLSNEEQLRTFEQRLVQLLVQAGYTDWATRRQQ